MQDGKWLSEACTIRNYTADDQYFFSGKHQKTDKLIGVAHYLRNSNFLIHHKQP